MSSLAAIILTLNEAKHLPDCLSSVQWADDVLVLDSFSTDRTVAIARAGGARVVQHPFANYAAQRDVALSLVQSDWVLFVDADERVTAALRAEIQALIADPAAAAGYWIPRQNYIFGAWIRHSGWYPDRQLRLLQRARAHYDAARPVHEVAELQGADGVLQHHFIHLNYETLGEFVRKQRAYARYDAQKMRGAGLRARVHNFILQPLREWRRRYLLLEGYRDGWRGALLSVLMAWYTWEVYRQLARSKENG